MGDRTRDMRTLVSVLALTAGLSACANLPHLTPETSSATADMPAAADNAINIAALDPLDAPPPAPDTPSNPVPSDSMLLVPAQTSASQRVPLGTLNASSDPKPAARPPTALTRESAAVAPSTSSPVFVPPPSAPAPVVPPPAAAAMPPTPSPAPITAPPPITTPPQPPNSFSLTIQPGAGTHETPRGVPATSQEPRIVAQAPSAAPSQVFEEETTIISSTTAPPAIQSREFVPAPVTPTPAAPPPPALGEMPITQAERNIARRFETLARLRDQGLITQEEFTRRRAANLGALLPYSQNPPSVGLDRSVPSAEAIVARLGALRRSFEMRAITAQQHALERTMIMNALLPENPEQRTVRRPPPEDVIQGAAMVGRLEALREDGVITEAELDAERRMIDTVLRTGLFPMKGSDDTANVAQAKTAAKPTAPAATAPAVENPMTTPITGPVLHIASFRSEASARQGWQEVLERNKAIIGTLKPIIRRIDLGEGKGVFYRLMTGSFTSMSDAEALCVKLKQNNQFCRASADGS